MLKDGRTDGRTDNGRKVITIAHPEQSSGELKSQELFKIVKGFISLIKNLQGVPSSLYHSETSRLLYKETSSCIFSCI